MTSKGVIIRPAALECPEQLGRVERRNAVLKGMVNKTIKELNVHGRKAVELVLTETCVAINTMSTKDGYTPEQWILGKKRREPGTMLNDEAAADIGTQQTHCTGLFQQQSQIRASAKQAFIEWDCSQKIQKALLRNAVPVPGPYQVGDIVSYCRRPRLGEHGTQWSVA